MKKICIVIAAILLSGCAATSTMISKSSLNVQTKMSSTVFLNPVEDNQKTIYVQVKNTSDKQFDISGKIKSNLESKGYEAVNSLSKAHYLIQVNILQVGKQDPSAAEKTLLGGYGSAISAASSGVAIGALAGNGSSNAMWAGGLTAGIIDTVANSAVKDVTFTATTDLQISERVAKGVKVNEEDESSLSQGNSSSVKHVSSSNSQWMKYQTRILSTAEKVNLSFDTARPMLEKGLADSISGIF